MTNSYMQFLYHTAHAGGVLPWTKQCLFCQRAVDRLGEVLGWTISKNGGWKMNCGQCGGDIVGRRAWLIDGPFRKTVVLCSEWCVRTWLGPDRPLTHRVEEAQKGRATPQDVVVEPKKSPHVMTDKWLDWAKSQPWYGNYSGR